MALRIDNRHYTPEIAMNTLSSKLTAFGAAVLMNSLIMGAVGFLFEIQSHPAIFFASRLAMHQWIV
jgi:hypothetical protein